MCRASKQAELFAISTILRQVFNWTYVSAFIRILFFRISTEFGVSHLDLASHHHPAEITNSRVSQPNFALKRGDPTTPSAYCSSRWVRKRLGAKIQSSWWLNHPFEKKTWVKLDHFDR